MTGAWRHPEHIFALFSLSLWQVSDLFLENVLLTALQQFTPILAMTFPPARPDPVLIYLRPEVVSAQKYNRQLAQNLCASTIAAIEQVNQPCSLYTILIYRT